MANKKNGKPETWTVMVYMSGDNNLREEFVFDLKEMKRVGSNGNLTVIAQFDNGGEVNLPYVIKRGDRDGVLRDDVDLRRQGILKGFLGGIGGRLNHRRVVTRESQSLPEVIKEFICSGIRDHGADHYMVVLSGHGSGSVGDFLTKTGNHPAASLSIPELGWLLAEVKKEMEKEGIELGENGKIDILGMDSCLMSMAEVGHEVRESVNFLVGAEGFEPLAGWPYMRVLSDFNRPNNNPRYLAAKIVEKYNLYYSDYTVAGASVDQSAWDLDQCDDLAGAVGKLGRALKENLYNPEIKRAILLAHWVAQSYKFEQYVDLYDFCSLLMNGDDKGIVPLVCHKVEKIREAGQAVMEIIKPEATESQPLVFRSCYSGPTVQYSHGVSIYFPWNAETLSAEYENLKFAKRTHWFDFLEGYVDATCRTPRNDCNLPEDEIQGPIITRFALPGSGFALLGNKNGGEADRNGGEADRTLENTISSMKNLPLTFFDCSFSPRQGRQLSGVLGSKGIINKPAHPTNGAGAESDGKTGKVKLVKSYK